MSRMLFLCTKCALILLLNLDYCGVPKPDCGTVPTRRKIEQRSRQLSSVSCRCFGFLQTKVRMFTPNSFTFFSFTLIHEPAHTVSSFTRPQCHHCLGPWTRWVSLLECDLFSAFFLCTTPVEVVAEFNCGKGDGWVDRIITRNTGIGSTLDGMVRERGKKIVADLQGFDCLLATGLRKELRVGWVKGKLFISTLSGALAATVRARKWGQGEVANQVSSPTWLVPRT